MENYQDEETIESLIAEFKSYGKLLAKQQIERCKLVARAKAKGKTGFEDFCANTYLKPDSSTTRKYLKIGLEADWLLPMADYLTDDWTTTYDVAVLGQATAEDLVSRGILHPQVTARELKAATTTDVSDAVPPDAEIETSDETNAAPEPCIFKVDATNLSDDQRLDLYHRLEEASAGFPVALTGLPDHLAERHIIEQEAA